MKKIVVIGGGGHAKVVISILKKTKKYEIVGFTDKDDKNKILGVDYIGNDNCLQKLYNQNVKLAVLGIGQISSADLRRTIVLKVKKIGFSFPSVVSTNAIINEDVNINEGTVLWMVS
jgi:UDP-perosamine 4-acetyltransferase